MTKLYLTISLLLLCAGAVCVPASDPWALPVSRLANWCCVVFFLHGLRKQIQQ